MEEFFLVLHALMTEKLNGIIDGVGLFDDRNIAVYVSMHPVFQLCGQFRRRTDPPENTAEAGISERKLDLYVRILAGIAENL